MKIEAILLDRSTGEEVIKILDLPGTDPECHEEYMSVYSMNVYPEFQLVFWDYQENAA